MNQQAIAKRIKNHTTKLRINFFEVKEGSCLPQLMHCLADLLTRVWQLTHGTKSLDMIEFSYRFD